MSTMGPLYPTVVSSAASSPYDDLDWVNIGNIVADDTSYGSLVSSNFDAGTVSYLAYTRSYGASIPAGGSITGIYAELGKWRSAGTARDANVQLMNGVGTVLGNNVGSTSTNWGAAIATATYGGSTNTWGATLTPTIVNGTAFGIQFAGSAVGANTDIWVDFIRMTVYYTLGESTPTVTPGEGTQSQASDAATLKAIYRINFTESTQAQISDAAFLSYLLSVGEGSQTQSGDKATLKPIYVLVSGDGTQAQASDSVTLAAITPITTGEGTQSQASDAATVKPIYILTTGEGTQAQAGDKAELEFHEFQAATFDVTPSEGHQTQTQDASTVKAIYTLVTGEGAQSQTGDAATVNFTSIGSTSITPSEGTQSQSQDASTVKAIYLLTTTESTQYQTSDAAGVTAITKLTAGEGSQTQTSDAATISYSLPTYYITPDEGSQSQDSDKATVSAIYLLTTYESTQTQWGDPAVATNATPYARPVFVSNTLTDLELVSMRGDLVDMPDLTNLELTQTRTDLELPQLSMIELNQTRTDLELPQLSMIELNQLRLDLENVMLPDIGVILTGTIVIDGMGGNVTTWGTTYADVHCRMDYVKGVKPVAGGVLQPFTGFMLTVPYDTPLTTNNRFEYEGEYYNVISVTSGSWQIDKRAELEKV